MIPDESFFLEGVNDGLIILIHGLTGTPREMEFVGKQLNKKGFHIYAPQLAGHCGTEDDLRQTGWFDWYESVVHALETHKHRYNHIFVAGLSMGAILSLKLAADYPTLVKGIAAYSVTFTYDGWSIPFYHKWLMPAVLELTRWGFFQKSAFSERFPYGLKDERLRALIAHSMFSGQSVEAGLAANPYTSLAEMMALVKITRSQLRDIAQPCLVMHAQEDDMASLKHNACLVKNRVSGPCTLIALENSYHMITLDQDKKVVVEKTSQFFSDILNTLKTSRK